MAVTNKAFDGEKGLDQPRDFVSAKTLTRRTSSAMSERQVHDTPPIALTNSLHETIVRVRTNPLTWSLRRKWTVTLLSTLATFTTLWNATIITVAHNPIGEEFHISDANFPNSYWLVTSWTIGGAIFTLMVLPLLEDFGMRTGFLATHIAFILLNVPQALAPNYATLVVFRFFAGGCATVLANTAASVIGNVWKEEHERTIPMSMYVTAYLAGIGMGPVVGAAVLQSLNWRWINWVQMIIHAALFPIYYFFYEESRNTAITEQVLGNSTDEISVERTVRPISFSRRFATSIKRPLHMLITEPVLLVFTLWSAFSVGAVYVFTQSTEQVFGAIHDWTAIQSGYVQAAVVIGSCIGGSAAYISSKFYAASARRNRENPGKPIPEARLYMSVIGSIVGVSGGMFIYGWTSYHKDSWLAPTVGLVLVGGGSVIIVNAAADYLVDIYTAFAGSAVAAVVLGENIVAAFLPLASQSMYTRLGFQWASTVLGLVSLMFALAPVALIYWGGSIRARSAYVRVANLGSRVSR